MLKIVRGLLLVPTALLCACEAKQLYVAHHTVIGVNAAVNTEQTSGHLVVGYDRNFGTLVPKSVPAEDGTPGKEAMAVLSCSELEVDGIFLTKFVEYLATGEAARRYAKAWAEATGADDSEAIFQCFDDAKRGAGKPGAGGGG